MTDITHPPQHSDDEIDLMALLATLWEGRWLIALLTLVFTAAGVTYALLAAPVYRATSVIQIERIPDNVSGLLGISLNVASETQMLKSRTVLEAVVDDLNLDIRVQPDYFPVIGEAVARRFSGAEGELARPLFGQRYAWGGERLEITRMDVPDSARERPLTFVADAPEWQLYDGEQLLLQGVVGELAQSGGYALMVRSLNARPGTRFTLTRLSRDRVLSEFQESFDVGEQSKGSGMISLGYEHTDYRQAKRILNAVWDQYAAQRLARISSDIIKALEALRARLPELEQALPEGGEQAGLPGSREPASEAYLKTLATIHQLELAQALMADVVRLVDPASVDAEKPLKPKKPLIVALAFLLGGFTGVMVVAIRALMNQGVEDPEKIGATGLPVYAGIPLSEPARKWPRSRNRQASGSAPGLPVLENPADPAVEGLRSLRTSLEFVMKDGTGNILMISGVSPDVGRSFVSANLAVLMAQAGRKVLLIDADMRRGRCHEILKTSAENGLSEVLSGQCSAEEAIRSPDAGGSLSFMPRGSLPSDPSGLLMDPRFERLLDKLSAGYDLVVIATPPILAVMDAAIVGRHAGTSMLVVRSGRTPLREIELANQRFRQSGVTLRGVILNGIVCRAGSYGCYTYEYQASGEDTAPRR